jgi:2,4-dienoyl-CoA reductase-like NADH-dependent reductase (Old Yellow Enzyme family)
MTQSTTPDPAFHRQHDGRLSLGGPGLPFTEALTVTAAGRVTNSDLGIWSNDRLPALAALVGDIERARAAALAENSTNATGG